MIKRIGIGLGMCGLALGLAVFLLLRPAEITHYTADDLVGLTCETLGERHEDVINAYHDAEIDHVRRTGTFHDDLGVPAEDIMPFAVLIKRFAEDAQIDMPVEPMAPFPILNSDFYYAVSAKCAATPSMSAVGAMHHVAVKMGLIVP